MQNLLEKLTKKFKENKLKMASLAVAGTLTMAAGLGAFAGCKNNENNHNSGSNTSTSQDYSDTNSSDTGNENSSSSGGNGSVDYSQFSETFKNVLNSAEYNALIYSDENSVTSGAPKSFSNAKYNAIPYGFLEDEGFDINKIKSNSLYSKSDMYLDNNNLFIELRVEIKSSKSYLANYILKYELNEKELNEIQLLFSSIGGPNGKTTYYQAPFFVQELSYLKDPEIISLAYTTLETTDIFESYASKKQYISYSTTATFMGSTFTDSPLTYQKYQIHTYLANEYSSKPIGTMKIGQISIYTFSGNPTPIDGVHVYQNTKSSAINILDEDKIKFENSIRTVTYLNSENSYFKDILKNNCLENEFNN